MDKKQAQAIIKETFETSFDKSRFIGFVKNLLNNIEEAPFTYRGNYIPDAYEQYINSLERIGKYNESEHKIDVLIVKLKKETSIERARTMQRNFIAWYLNGSRGDVLKDAALVAFVSPNEEDWRFSLVKMDYRFEEGKGGRLKVKEEFTPARRWSFLVGANEKSHTAQRQLVDIVADDENNPTLVLLENAFNIETVTKEFFEEYRKLFLCVKETLDDVVRKDRKIKTDFETKGVNTVDFSKKLLGQIVFLYFLQKKGWFGVKRDADWGTGPKNFLRELFEEKHGMYKNFFNDILEPLFYEALARERDDDFYSRFNCKVPFLNGGLFDPIGNYDWVHTDILLPNELFSNTRRTKEGDIGDGILDIFDRYNFTVKEDEPLEKEVAIDPELLGKAYEKFNAIRPDNYAEYEKALKSGQSGAESKFNKQYGVYYTPREIVHYMCQQSLINYLATELEGKVAKEDIETLIKYGEQVGENEATVESKGRETDTYCYKLPESIRQNAKLVDEKLANIKVCDPAIGSGAFPVGMMSEIVKIRNVLSVYLKIPGRTIYNFKRECIEKSLYGVDIDPGAVEIAKLRLWLSLVVDEEDIKQIKPLPNLDYKIVCGDSLLGVEKNLFNLNLFNELERLKPLLFNETNPKKKQEYKKQIDEIIRQITNGHKDFDFEVYFSEVFHEKKGFDIVIANPPYISYYSRQAQKIDKRKYAYYLEHYEFLKNTKKKSINSAMLFLERAINILSERRNFVYIIDIGFFEKVYKEIRNFISEFNILEIVTDISAFEEVASGQLVIFVKKERASSFQCAIKRDFRKINKSLSREEFKGDTINISFQEKMFKELRGTTPLGDICDITCGLEYGALRDLFLSREKKSEKYHKVVNGGFSIPQRYCLRWGQDRNGYVLFDKEFEEKLVKKHLNVSKTKKIVHFISGDENKYKEEKLLIRQSALEIIAAHDDQSYYALRSIFLCNQKDKSYDLKYVLALLNSKFLTVYSRLNGIIRYVKGKQPQIRVDGLNKIPIKISSSQNELIQTVNKILSITKDADYLENSAKQSKVKEYERQIDQMVYNLYGLTKEEVNIVESFMSGEKTDK